MGRFVALNLTLEVVACRVWSSWLGGAEGLSRKDKFFVVKVFPYDPAVMVAFRGQIAGRFTGPGVGALLLKTVHFLLL